MLIQVPYKKLDTITLKLSSGDEVIGRFEEETETTITLTKPMTFIMGPQGLGLVPYLFSAPDAKVDIDTRFVICKIKTEGNVAKQYVHQTTGLAI